MKVWHWIIISILTILAVLYFIGPKVANPPIDGVISKEVPDVLQVQNQVKSHEAAFHIKPGNEAKIVWADSIGQKTRYSLVYLHGFAASREEGALVHKALADSFGMNLYLARLFDHGLVSDEPLLSFSPTELIKSAKDAIRIGQSLGEDVIVMGTSTGATCALYLAAHNPEMIDGLLLYSPNIAIYDKRAGILTKPWGLQIARKIAGSKYRYWEGVPEAARPFWYTKQRVEGVVALQALVEQTMTEETFADVDQPLLMTYYYKDEEHQDKTVSVKAMLEMFDEVATPETEKVNLPIPDGGHHIITSPIFAENKSAALDASVNFLRDVMKISPQ